MDWRKKYQNKIVSADEAASHVKSGDWIATTSESTVPYVLFDALYEQRERLHDVNILMGFSGRLLKLTRKECQGHITVNSLFFNAYERASNRTPDSRTEIQVIQLSRFYEDRMYVHPVNVIVAAVSPPNENGEVSLGLHAMNARLCKEADLVIVQINENIPFIMGRDNKIPLKDVDFIIDHTEELPSMPVHEIKETDYKIADFVAERIPNGACLQFGIGGLGNAVGLRCREKKYLGIHTEILTESMIDLIECGAVDNSQKSINTGVTIFNFAMHTPRMAKFLNYNKTCESWNFSYTNDPYRIGRNDNVFSVNSGMQVDITGQVASEGVGFQQFSGVGGQLDFVRGSQLSRGGHSFIAIESTRTDKEGKLHSKIVVGHPPGTPVSTPRSEVEFIVTEYGVAKLKYETVENRAKRLIEIAHPDFRDELTFEAKKLGIII